MLKNDSIISLLVLFGAIACGGDDSTANTTQPNNAAGAGGTPGLETPPGAGGPAAVPAPGNGGTPATPPGAGGASNVPATTATLNVSLEPEGDILVGLIPGLGDDDIRDGWGVTYTKLIAVLGDVHALVPADGTIVTDDDDVFAVDVIAPAAAQGVPLWTLDNLPGGTFDFTFQSRSAVDAMRHASVLEADFTEMQTNAWTYLVEGVLQRADGQSCPPNALATPPVGVAPVGTNAGGDNCYANPMITFRIGANAESELEDCELAGVPGFTIAAGATSEGSITIHGDHLFFNGFPADPVLVAQWFADLDLNLDGDITQAEVSQTTPADLSALDGLTLTPPFPSAPIVNTVDYLGALMRTFPEYNGEGECAIIELPVD